MRLYGRKIKLTFYRAKGYFGKLANGLIVDQSLRVRGTVERSNDREPNRCRLAIYNVAQDTAAFVSGAGVACIVEAGYGDEVRRLFVGDVRHAFQGRDGASRFLDVVLADGDKAYRHGRLRKSYAPGVTIGEIVRDAARSVDLAVPADLLGQSFMAQQIGNGLTAAGKTRDVLTNLLAPFGYSWSIQDGRLQVLADSQVRAEEPFLISEATGMIDSPSLSPPDKGKRPVIGVSTKLYPQVYPGARIRVQSSILPRHNGTYKIERVSHVLDTHGDEWDTEMEGKEIS